MIYGLPGEKDKLIELISGGTDNQIIVDRIYRMEQDGLLTFDESVDKEADINERFQATGTGEHVFQDRHDKGNDPPFFLLNVRGLERTLIAKDVGKRNKIRMSNLEQLDDQTWQYYDPITDTMAMFEFVSTSYQPSGANKFKAMSYFALCNRTMEGMAHFDITNVTEWRTVLERHLVQYAREAKVEEHVMVRLVDAYIKHLPNIISKSKSPRLDARILHNKTLLTTWTQYLQMPIKQYPKHVVQQAYEAYFRLAGTNLPQQISTDDNQPDPDCGPVPMK